jgi:hypothetical protein
MKIGRTCRRFTVSRLRSAPHLSIHTIGRKCFIGIGQYRLPRSGGRGVPERRTPEAPAPLREAYTRSDIALCLGPLSINLSQGVRRPERRHQNRPADLARQLYGF